MKKYIVYSVAALALVGCQNDILIDDAKQDAKEIAVGFSTYAPLTTKAENSLENSKLGLSEHHDAFYVWGFKNVAATQTPVFNKQSVTYSTTNTAWEYTPVRFWDRAASVYYYYAAAPQLAGWTLATNSTATDYSDDYFTYADYVLTAENASKTNATAYTESFKKKLSTDKDLMIAEPVNPTVTQFTAADYQVHLDFIHILSRLNVSVSKGANLQNQTVTLKKLEIEGLNSKGTFDESLKTGSELKNGTSGRWTSSTPLKYSAMSDVVLSQLTTVPTDIKGYDYLLQALVVPQDAGYEDVKLDGTKEDNSDKAKPYLTLTYEVKDGSNEPESFTVTYNLAKIFGADGTPGKESISFNEGWQNILHITINPTSIEFCADVYNWDVNEEDNLEVK